MEKRSILFISGVPDNKKTTLTKVKKNGMVDLVHSGSSNIFQYLHDEKFHRLRLIFDANPTQEVMRLQFHAVFNQISDPDTHKVSLIKTKELKSKLPENLPFFNDPDKVVLTTRDNIYTLLHGIEKLNVPKTIRIQPKTPAEIYEAIKQEKFKFPVILRQAGYHGGINTILVKDKTEQFHAFALDGRDYYLTQFTDYAENKTYKKFRLAIVKGEPFIRHVIYSDSWMVHSGSRSFMEKHPEYIQKEKKLIQTFNTKIKPHILPTVQKIYKTIGLDYFGIDCYIDKNHNITVFEINANMNMLLNSSKEKNNIWEKQINLIIKAIESMIKDRITS